MLASIVALVGGALFLYSKKLSGFLEAYGVSFAAGTLIITSLVGLLPEANHILGVTSFAIFAAAFFATFAFEQLLAKLHHHQHEHEDSSKNLRKSVPMVLVGDTIHNFIDGVAIATAYLVNPGLALATAFSTFLHEVPHEIGDFSILLKVGWKKTKVLLINAVSSLSTVLGAWLVYHFTVGLEVQGYLLAISAGIFLYLGAIDFLPHAFEGADTTSRFKQVLKGLVPVLAGALIMMATLAAVPHSHEHEAHDDEAEHAHEHLEEEHVLEVFEHSEAEHDEHVEDEH